MFRWYRCNNENGIGLICNWSTCTPHVPPFQGGGPNCVVWGERGGVVSVAIYSDDVYHHVTHIMTHHGTSILWNWLRTAFREGEVPGQVERGQLILTSIAARVELLCPHLTQLWQKSTQN
jgi:hypothetical protein